MRKTRLLEDTVVVLLKLYLSPDNFEFFIPGDWEARKGVIEMAGVDDASGPGDWHLE